jgi:hypothetical protein
MTTHDCLIDPCPICAIEGRLQFATETPWNGDKSKLKETVEELTILRRRGHHAALTAAAPRPRKRPPTLSAALNVMSHSRAYIPPTASDYFSY